MPDADPYAAERHDPTHAPCHALALLFDGNGLSMFASGKLLKTHSAVSGRPSRRHPDFSDPESARAALSAAVSGSSPSRAVPRP
jgi:hypothetical protein